MLNDTHLSCLQLLQILQLALNSVSPHYHSLTYVVRMQNEELELLYYKTDSSSWY